MDNIAEHLLSTLNDLSTERLGEFQWFLRKGVEGLPGIPMALLEKSTRHDTVDKMVQMYGPDEAVKITRAILKKMNLNQQAEKLQTKIIGSGAVSASIKQKLVEASPQLQEKICSGTGLSPETKKAGPVLDGSELCEVNILYPKELQSLEEKEKKMQELKQAADTIKCSAQAAVEDSEKIFNEIISSIEKKHCEVRQLIRDQEKNELSLVEGLLKKVEQEITEDHIHFLQRFRSLCVSSEFEDSSSIPVPHQYASFDGVKKSLSDLKEHIEVFCKKKFNKITPLDAAVQILPSEPKTREDFLKYFHLFILEPNTAHRRLRLSDDNRVVTCYEKGQQCDDHPERFNSWVQVLSKESVCGRRYWEVEWSIESEVYISVSYKGISRKGRSDECRFGYNPQSWSLQCSPRHLRFWHNSIKTAIPGPPPYRIGVYMDHSAGTLSFYNVSDTMTHLHTAHTTFTEPLYAGFWLVSGSSVKLCDPK